MNELTETTKEIIRVALENAITLEEAEEALKAAKANFRESSRQITFIVGVELWHTDAEGGKYFWRDDKQESAYYPGPADALRAFLDNQVNWRKS